MSPAAGIVCIIHLAQTQTQTQTQTQCMDKDTDTLHPGETEQRTNLFKHIS